jgi:hypothetical protein
MAMHSFGGYGVRLMRLGIALGLEFFDSCLVLLYMKRAEK